MLFPFPCVGSFISPEEDMYVRVSPRHAVSISLCGIFKSGIIMT